MCNARDAKEIQKSKIKENVQAEIMQVIRDEARESYDRKIVVEFQSDNIEQMEANVQQISEWLKNYKIGKPYTLTDTADSGMKMDEDDTAMSNTTTTKDEELTFEFDES